MEKNRWYRIRIEFLLSNATKQMNKMNFYVDGKQILKEKAYISTSYTKIDILDSIKFSNVRDSIYIDNFMVYKNTGQYINKGTLISNIRLAETKIVNAVVGNAEFEYSQASINSMTEAFNAAKAIYEKENATQSEIDLMAVDLSNKTDQFLPHGKPIHIDKNGGYNFTDQSQNPVTSLENVTGKLKMRVPIKSNDLVDPDKKASIAATLILYKKSDDIPEGEILQIVSSGVVEFGPNQSGELVAQVDMSPFASYTQQERKNMFVRVFVWDNYNAMKSIYDVVEYLKN